MSALENPPPLYCAVEAPPDGEPRRFMLYGDAGSKKSTFVATMPKPMLVLQFDPLGKEAPYLRQGRPTEWTMEPSALPKGGPTPVRYIYAPDTDEIIIRIEHYLDQDIEAPEAWGRYLARSKRLYAEAPQWGTIVWDSVTFMEMCSRYWSRYRINKTAATGGDMDGRAHYNFSKEALEAQLQCKAGVLSCNVAVVAHVSEDKDEFHGKMIYNPAAPGKLARKLPAGFSELYHCFVQTEGKKNTFLMQTEKNAQFNAHSQLPAPNPCAPDYAALWPTE